MKTAIIISGNLRTFLMPTRENPNKKICDLFIDHILSKNDCDIFIFTDTNDFYYNGTQYYLINKDIEITNNNAFRLHNNIDFIDNENAKNIITDQLKQVFGTNLKSLNIEAPYQADLDEKFKLLFEANVNGSNPIPLINQFRKLKLAYKIFQEYEINNNIKYDTIAKWRFDLSISGDLNFNSYDYVNNDIFVAGIHSPIIYDWFAFGNRKGMDLFMSIYDNLGDFLHEGRIYMCNICFKYNNTFCLDHGNTSLYEITLSSEYHLFKVFNQNNIKLHNSGYSACPYRYQDINTETTVDDIIKKLNINALVTSYTSGHEVFRTKYSKI